MQPEIYKKADGKCYRMIPFFRNDNPNDFNGNFAHTLKNITPYVNQIFMPPKIVNTPQNQAKLDGLKPLVSRMVSRLISRCKTELGVDLLVTEGYRSKEKQDAIYAQGRTAPGKIVTNAKGGQSLHQYHVAVDICPLVGGKLAWNYPFEKIGKIGKEIGLEWGGGWKLFQDKPHFQCTLGYTLSDFQLNKIDWNKFN